MVDITHKTNTLRVAVAKATVKVGKAETIDAIKNGKVPKGDVLATAKVAGLFGVKKTAELIPDCHPLPVEYTGVDYELGEKSITISIKVKTIYKTGVEVEAMHGASLVALTIYDMLKPIDKEVSIENIHLESKSGGKSDIKDLPKPIVGVVVISDSVSAAKSSDKSGKVIQNKIHALGLTTDETVVVPDEKEAIQNAVQQLVKEGVKLIITTGGTGVSPRDITPESIQPLFTKDISQLMDAARNYGYQRTPKAMFSRSIAGIINDTLVLCLPGSSKAVEEYLNALFPHVLHLFDVMEGTKHN